MHTYSSYFYTRTNDKERARVSELIKADIVELLYHTCMHLYFAKNALVKVPQYRELHNVITN